MITVSPAQVDAVSGGIDDALVERIAAWLAPQQPVRARALPPPQLRAATRSGIAEARKVGLRWESNLAAFCALSIALSPDFHHAPEIRRIMEERDDTPDMRWRRVSAAVPDATWRQAYRS